MNGGWNCFYEKSPSFGDGDFFIVKGKSVCDNSEFAEIAFWSGVNFMSIESDGESFLGPIKGIEKWKNLEDWEEK